MLALALNVLVGYAGLTSLGHAGLFAMAGYTAALMLAAGHGHFVADLAALAVTLVTSAVFAVLALRATGIGFLMITLAIGQILWGIAYRWASLTNGDNGINVSTRPAPFGHQPERARRAFYYATLVVFLLAVATMAVFVRSPFGASLRGTRDQARRMTALGYNVWLIRFLAILFSGFWSGVAGLLFIYYNQFISPQVVALTTSAEALLMVISGGSGTLLGPIVGAAIVVIMKNVVSAYIERWNLVLGVIFILIISFMPEGLVPGSVRLWRAARQAIRAVGGAGADADRRRSAAHDARSPITGSASPSAACASPRNVNLAVEPGERRLIIGPNGAGKTTLFNLITGEIAPDSGSIALFGRDITRTAVPRPRAPRHGAHLPDHHAVPARHHPAQRHAGAARSLAAALERRSSTSTRSTTSSSARARRSPASASTTSPSGRWRRPPTASAAASRSPWRWRRTRRCCCWTSRSPASPIDERRDVQKLLAAIPREVTVVMIEHNMDVALDFADRITLLHFGEVIVEGTRAEVVADPRTREVYLGA